jgi:hypothetical protein
VEPALYDINGDGRPDIQADEKTKMHIGVPPGAVVITDETPTYNPANVPGSTATASPPGIEPPNSQLYPGIDSHPSFSGKRHPTGRLPGPYNFVNSGTFFLTALGIFGLAFFWYS